MNIERLRALEKLLEPGAGRASDFTWDCEVGPMACVRATIAALIAELGQEVGAVAWTKDAEAYGNALNEAAWKFVEECPEKSALLFNNTKKPLRAAILTYAEHVARATSPAHTSDVERERDALLAFKQYVHQRLDDAGVPVDPPSEHRDAGCRVGGRLDIALAPYTAHTSEARDAARYQWLVERGFVFRGCESVVDGYIQGEWLYRNHGADAAIDAAMRQEGGTP